LRATRARRDPLPLGGRAGEGWASRIDHSPQLSYAPHARAPAPPQAIYAPSVPPVPSVPSAPFPSFPSFAFVPPHPAEQTTEASTTSPPPSPPQAEGLNGHSRGWSDAAPRHSDTPGPNPINPTYPEGVLRAAATAAP